LIQAVTFRLADSMPQDRRHEWGHLLEISDSWERTRQIEEWLDKGAGSCLLRQPDCAEIVRGALLHFNLQRYRLNAWCVMPNHVHVLFEVFDGHPMGTVIHSWKTFTTREINKLLSRSGSLWQADYFDRYMRDEEHRRNECTYIEANPVTAGLAKTPEEWPFSSASVRQ
jgi:REP element-mobilizing transposase RayT